MVEWGETNTKDLLIIERLKVKIVKYLDLLSEKTQTLRHTQDVTAENLTALEQSILHQAFTGELV